MLVKSRLHFPEHSITLLLINLLQALIFVVSDHKLIFFLCFVFQLLEPVLLLGKERFAGVDIRVRVKGGGHVAQIYGMIFGGISGVG